MSQRKTSMAPPPNSNLYCTSCDSQIGIFDNEWTHLTTSYARSQDKGTHFGTEVGVKTQIVPVGSAQKNAEGCEMSEVYCTKCSTVVAQYCRTAPEPSKQHFVGQYFYKLSRVYLKDSHNSSNIEMKFIDGDAEQSQRVLHSASSDTAPRPRLPPARAASDAPFRQSLPPPSNQSWARPPVQGHSLQPAFPTDFRSASAQPVLEFRHDQLAPLAECAGRITATDMRLANQEMRFNTSQEKFHDLEVRVDKYVERLEGLERDIDSFEPKLSNLRDDYTHLEACIDEQDNNIERHRYKMVSGERDIANLESDFRDQDTVVKEQQVKIEEQDQELRRVTAKLEELQRVIEDLKTKVDENRAQHLSIRQATNLPLPQDFLENLEVMVKAMKNTKSDSDEVRALRDENRAMKTRLNTIATTMGFTLESDLDTLDEEISVLGKRKRAAGFDVVQRKMSRHYNGSPAELTQSAPSLPTPDSSQNTPLLSTNARNEDKNGVEGSMDDAEGADLVKTVEGVEKGAIRIADDDDMMENAEREETTLIDPQLMTTVNGTFSESHEQAKHALETSTVAPSDQTRIAFAQQSSHSNAAEHNLRLNPIHREPNPPTKTMQSVKNISVAAAILHQGSSKIARASFTSNRPVSMMERMRSPSVRNSPAPLPFSVPSVLPPSQINMASDRLMNSRQEKTSASTLRRPETFSGALSRGETLERIVQRRRSSQTPDSNCVLGQRSTATREQHHSQDELPEAQSQILQPCQDSRLNARTTTVLSSNLLEPTDTLPVAESVEFSDEENEPSNGRKGEHHVNPSQTPSGEPKVGSTLISRTIPGLTFKPLVRPVIEDENNDINRAGSRRQSISAVRIPGAPAILPEILVAIKNLNDCVVSQPATPVFSTPGPRSNRTQTKTKNPKKVRKSEPISKRPTEAMPIVDCPEPSAIMTRSKNSTNDSVDHMSATVMASMVSDTDNTPNPPGESSQSASRRTENVSDDALPPRDEVAHSQETSQLGVSQQQVPKKVNSRKQSLSRQQLLMERNRLAMEAMEREEAGQRLSKIAV